VDDSYNAFDRQLEEFIAAIDQGTRPPVTAEYGRELVRVLVACQESARTGREVVL
jgi:predicted dehydrogenase